MSIIARNGKIGAGKDTVGKIIQLFTYLNNECDWKESEKKEALKDLYKGNIDSLIHDIGIGRGYGDWKIKKFAGKLKQIASILTGISIEKFEDQEFKKTFLGEEWSYYYSIELPNKILTKENYDKASVNQKTWFSKHEMTVRDLLQKLGTEALRNGLHENVWVNSLFANYKPTNLQEKFNELAPLYPTKSFTTKNIPLVYSNWLITDLRFPNEFQAVKERNGICVRVIRHQHPNDIDYKTLHPSETSLDSFIFDYEINNSGSIEDLVEEVRKMLINFKII